MRIGLSKRTRFEIFKRDGFTCQYCGRRPPEVMLVIDHIHPVAEGGDNDTMNLVTSCEACNQGKADKLLARIAPRPDADAEWLESQQEIAELNRYQAAKVARDKAREQTAVLLQGVWCECVPSKYMPDTKLFREWLAWTSPNEIEQAIRITGRHLFHLPTFDDQIRYTAGILRRGEKERRANGGE